MDYLEVVYVFIRRPHSSRQASRYVWETDRTDDPATRLHAQKQATGDSDAVATIRQISPDAWQHVDFFGTFEFSDEDFLWMWKVWVARDADTALW